MPRWRQSEPAIRRCDLRAISAARSIEVLGVPSLVLMENAGRNAADCIARWHRIRTSAGEAPGPIVVVCGKGNNGGDGFVIARHLANRGYEVSVDLAGKESDLTDDAAVNHGIVRRMGFPIRPLIDKRQLAAAAGRWRSAAVIVDAIFGTGIRGAVGGHLADVIQRINAIDRAPVVRYAPTSGPLVVAIDAPSGLDVDSGEAAGPAVRADHTISFLAPKIGYTKRSARPYVGRITVIDIGVPTEWIIERLDHPSS
jgi:NAD(P)H-hydrate epimerase